MPPCGLGARAGAQDAGGVRHPGRAADRVPGHRAAAGGLLGRAGRSTRSPTRPGRWRTCGRRWGPTQTLNPKPYPCPDPMGAWPSRCRRSPSGASWRATRSPTRPGRWRTCGRRWGEALGVILNKGLPADRPESVSMISGPSLKWVEVDFLRASPDAHAPDMLVFSVSHKQGGAVMSMADATSRKLNVNASALLSLSIGAGRRMGHWHLLPGRVLGPGCMRCWASPSCLPSASASVQVHALARPQSASLCGAAQIKQWTVSMAKQIIYSVFLLCSHAS